MSLTTTDSTGHGRKRRSIRLQGYDYFQVGAYYVTVCTRNRECLFGNVVDGQMQLNEAEKIIQSVWDELPHSAPAGAIHESPLPSIGKSRATVERVFDRRRMLLAKLIGRFKMVTAKQINALRGSSGEPLWQRNYYEHVIRDDRSLNRFRQYIADNPVQWDLDCENPSVSAAVRRGDS